MNRAPAALRRRSTQWLSVLGLLLLGGCAGPQSTLDPAGQAAEDIARLFWIMVAGAVVIWTTVIGLAIYALRLKPEAHPRRRSGIWIIGGGVIAPTVILTGLVIYSLAFLPQLLARPPEGSLQIRVDGLQWWWRVTYLENGETDFELANEIHLPVGEPVEFLLSSPDVIHSFWIPALGGKVDMIPGRETRLTLMPTRTGTFRGVCAEYCGASHALMNFTVVVSEPEDYQQWLAEQRSPARQPAEELTILGRELFVSSGCGACHSVRGTDANGRIAPDLTHVGSRHKLGADVLPNDRASFERWIRHTDTVKPDVLMPEYHSLDAAELTALAAYLESLD